jgi:uncharacterized membrane protein YgcG
MIGRNVRFAVIVWLAGLVGLPLGARELHWSDFAVKARLDAAGALHVVERQTIVFTGDWNGGYRKFRIGPGQKLEFEGIRRIDPATDAATPLVSGDTSDVDHYDFSDPTTVRWRSRRRSDPPFSTTALTYELVYTLSGILSRAGGTYQLDHDFAFPDRDGVIERFTLDLELDPAWTAIGDFPSHVSLSGVPAGRGVVVRGNLRFHGAVAPAAAMGLPRWAPGAALALFGLGFVVLVARFRAGEIAAGHYRELTPSEEIDRGWLETNVFTSRPEEVGAAWDGDIGAPEVAAVLARLVEEGKLASRVESGAGASGKGVLHLELKAPRSAFQGYERELVDKLFFDDRKETDTESVREHYRSTGFDPSKILQGELAAAKASDEKAAPASGLAKALSWLLALSAVGLFAFAVVSMPQADRGIAMAAGMGIVFTGVFGAVIAAVVAKWWTVRHGRVLDTGLPLLLLPGSLVTLLALGFLRAYARAGPTGKIPAALALSLLCWAFLAVAGYLRICRSPSRAETVERRRIFASARRFFEGELAKPVPRLEDRWYPYVLAFGLGEHVDRWFRSFGGAATGVTSGSTSFSSGGGSSSSWTGGGGSFGGAGASAGWAGAAAGIAAGVAAPSSGGSGGGGGGGSSGGGGGGGW